MVVKPRYESLELRIFRSLYTRMHLSDKEVNYYFNLEKGFQGEVRFDELFVPRCKDFLILNDLLFEVNNTIFQIDSLYISQDTIYLFEIKYFEGDFYIENGKWYTKSGVIIKDPLLQMERCESLFQRLLQFIGCHFKIKANLIFVNPEFFLYEALPDYPIIYPAQINRFLNKFSTMHGKLDKRHYNLATQLLSLHITDNPYSRVPKYDFDQLKKGVTCAKCHSFIDGYHDNIVVCSSCGSAENLESAVLRNVEDYRLLFPERKITTGSIYEWCEAIKWKWKIQNILSSHYKMIGSGKSSYYVSKNK